MLLFFSKVCRKQKLRSGTGRELANKRRETSGETVDTTKPVQVGNFYITFLY